MRPIKFEYKITFIYLIIGVLWIIFSDSILNRLATSDQIETFFQSIKGIFYVATTGLLLYILTLRYVKKQNAIEETLRESNEKYKSLYEQAPLAYQSLDTNGNFIDINPQWSSVLGYKKEEVIGKWFGDFVHPDFVDFFKEHFPEFKKKGHISDVQFQMKKKDGSFIYVSYQGCVGYAPDGSFKQTYCTFKDITVEHEAQQKLIENKKRYKALFAENVSIILLIDAETGKILDANRSALDFYKYSLSDIKKLGVNDINVLPEEDIKNEMQNAIAEKRNYFQFKHKLATGEIRDVEVYSSKIKTENKTLLYSIINDISKQIQTEKELIKAKEKAEESEAKFKAAFFTSPDSVNINAMNGEYIEINEGFTKITGYTREDVIGLKSSEIQIWDDPKDRATLIKELKKNGVVENLEAVFRTKDGSPRIALMSARIIQIDNKPHILSVTRDISARKNMENALIIAKEKAEESDRLKSAFLANMSHEIRTPLNGVLGFANILNENVLPPQTVKRYAEIISKSGQRLLELINNILDISKIESGNMNIDITRFPPAKIIDDVIDLFHVNAEKRNLQIIRNIQEKDKDLFINSDQLKINQILTNLVSNAIKFTKNGSVEIGFNLHANSIVFYVKDTGQGIPTETQVHLFDRFYQVSQSLSRGHEGSGLGLSLCKSLVELLQGHIQVKSNIGEGSLFSFTLPTTLKSNNIEVTPKNHPTLNLKLNKVRTILIAEDDEINYEYLKEVFSQSALKILHAKNGKEAVDLCNSKTPIDLVLMDIKMPIMDGREALYQIKQIRPNLKIIAQTAYAMKNDEAKILKSGFDGYMSKPVNKDSLLNLIR